MITTHSLDGRKSRVVWTDAERAVVLANYRKGGAKVVAGLLPHRTLPAIYREAERLNLVSKRPAIWADSLLAATMLGLAESSTGKRAHDRAAAFFADRGITLRRKVKGRPAVLLGSLAQWIATNPPEFDLQRVDQAWFVSKLLRA